MRRADCETDTMQDSKEDADKKSKPAKNNKERLRRLKENGFIEQLAEIISANYSDMNSDSPRPQKCSIMRKAINLIRVNQSKCRRQFCTRIVSLSIHHNLIIARRN